MSTNSQTENQKEIKKENWFSRPWKFFLSEAILFSLTLGLGIAAAFKINQFLEIQKIEVKPLSFWQFIISFALATLIVFLILRFVRLKKGKLILFKTLFVFAVFLGGIIFLSLWIGDILALLVILVLIIFWLKSPNVLVHDFLLITGMAGIGSSLGLKLDPLVIVLLLVIFSIYDWVAVYKTKHMVKMAKAMLESGAILGLILPSQIGSFSEDIKKVKPGGKFLVLGGGDIIFPLILCSSLIPQGIANSLIVGLFALVGLFVSFLIFIKQKTRKPIPALPPIALFSIIGYFLTRII